MKLLVKNIGQLVTVVEGKEVCLAGKGMSQIKVVLVIVQMLMAVIIMMVAMVMMMLVMVVIKVREGNADQPLAVAVDDDGLLAMVDCQKQVLDQNQIIIDSCDQRSYDTF